MGCGGLFDDYTPEGETREKQVRAGGTKAKLGEACDGSAWIAPMYVFDDVNVASSSASADSASASAAAAAGGAAAAGAAAASSSSPSSSSSSSGSRTRKLWMKLNRGVADRVRVKMAYGTLDDVASAPYDCLHLASPWSYRTATGAEDDAEDGDDSDSSYECEDEALAARSARERRADPAASPEYQSAKAEHDEREKARVKALKEALLRKNEDGTVGDDVISLNEVEELDRLPCLYREYKHAYQACPSKRKIPTAARFRQIDLREGQSCDWQGFRFTATCGDGDSKDWASLVTVTRAPGGRAVKAARGGS